MLLREPHCWLLPMSCGERTQGTAIRLSLSKYHLEGPGVSAARVLGGDPPMFFISFFNIYLLGCTGSSLWQVELSSLTRDQSQAPCIVELRVLATGPPGKSLKKSLFSWLHHTPLGNFPDQGWNPVPLQWKPGVLSAGPPGKSTPHVL